MENRHGRSSSAEKKRKPPFRNLEAAASITRQHRDIYYCMRLVPHFKSSNLIRGYCLSLEMHDFNAGHRSHRCALNLRLNGEGASTLLTFAFIELA
jgi:hypothetical protein